jgi:CubicO group peptidase (beta-lactamase class C family)
MYQMLIRWLAIVAMVGLLSACGSSSSSSSPEDAEDSFAAVAAIISTFIEDQAEVDGVGLILVDREQGVIHEEAFGDNEIDSIFAIASVSKISVAAIMMALHDEEHIDIAEPINTYLDWGDRYPDLTTEHLLSNHSGLPGLMTHGLPYPPHTCMFLPDGNLLDCAEAIYTDTDLDDVVDPNTEYRYGGGQWHLAGAVAEEATGWTWWQMVDELLVQPCDLDVFEFGNPFGPAELGYPQFDGTPESLPGQANPNIEGGAISHIGDMGKLLLMHLNDGLCGDNRVLSEVSAQLMREDRRGPAGTLEVDGLGAGLGWQITIPDDASDPTLFHVPGAFGSVAWIDTERGYGGYITMDADTVAGVTLWSMIRPQIEAILDAE